jgi:hypothetical protein
MKKKTHGDVAADAPVLAGETVEEDALIENCPD